MFHLFHIYATSRINQIATFQTPLSTEYKRTVLLDDYLIVHHGSFYEQYCKYKQKYKVQQECNTYLFYLHSINNLNLLFFSNVWLCEL